MKPNIMFVDDSISVLESLKWIFMDELYHILLFDNPLKALKAIDFKEFSVVVADQSMPEMAGIEFLKKVKQRSPDTVGMIMSGFVEPEIASNVMNRGVVNRFIQKPLDINEIKQAVAIALARYKINVESIGESMSIFQPRTVFPLQQ
ncbi:MAG: response regulator [Deltaproteobacteria bacterium]|nr:response regulator [Deltaproteobacteria bacterium]